jgi:hypothetical protein
MYRNATGIWVQLATPVLSNQALTSTQNALPKIQTKGKSISTKPKYQTIAAKKIKKLAKPMAPNACIPFNRAHSQAPVAIKKSASAQKGHGLLNNSVGNTMANMTKAVITRCLSIFRLDENSFILN